MALCDYSFEVTVITCNEVVGTIDFSKISNIMAYPSPFLEN